MIEMSHFRNALLLLPLGFVLACGSGSASAEPPKGGTEMAQSQWKPNDQPAGLTHKKGWELFTWRGDEDERLRFTLVIGTPASTLAPHVVFSRDRGDGQFCLRGQGNEALLTALRKLANGQEVLWNSPAMTPEPIVGIAVEMPASAELGEVVSLAEQQGLRLTVPD